MEATEYPLTRYTKNYLLMNSLYRNSWLARRIIDLPARDMLKNWVNFENSFDPEELKRFTKLERLTQVKAKLFSALSWGRLYGGAGAIMMIDGQEDRLE
jgi:phage-related protein (TIGR01555 family)